MVKKRKKKRKTFFVRGKLTQGAGKGEKLKLTTTEAGRALRRAKRK